MFSRYLFLKKNLSLDTAALADLDSVSLHAHRHDSVICVRFLAPDADTWNQTLSRSRFRSSPSAVGSFFNVKHEPKRGFTGFNVRASKMNLKVNE